MKTASKWKAGSPTEEELAVLRRQLGMRRLRGRVDWKGDLDAWRRDSDMPLLDLSEQDIERIAQRAAASRAPNQKKDGKSSG
jgi:hypothetical protein